MRGAILRKAVKDIACEESQWVTGRVVGFCNIDVTKIAEFGSSVSARTLGSVTGSEQGRDKNIMANNMSKYPSKSIYIYHNLVTSVNYSEMITPKSLHPATNHWYFPFIF